MGSPSPPSTGIRNSWFFLFLSLEDKNESHLPSGENCGLKQDLSPKVNWRLVIPSVVATQMCVGYRISNSLAIGRDHGAGKPVVVDHGSGCPARLCNGHHSVQKYREKGDEVFHKIR